jgi:hypothetical protein
LKAHQQLNNASWLPCLQLGGNSLQAGAMLSRLRAALQLEHSIPIVWVFETQTIEGLAARLAEDSSIQDLPALPPLTATVSVQPDAAAAHIPLSFQQEQFYQLWERAPDSAALNSGFSAMLLGSLHVPTLQAAVASVFERQQVCMRIIGLWCGGVDCFRCSLHGLSSVKQWTEDMA